MLKIKDSIIGTGIAGAVISLKLVISVGAGVLKANNLNSLSESRRNFMLTGMWAKDVLEETTGKLETSKQLLAEEKFTFQMCISKVVCENDIPSEVIINLDQIFLKLTWKLQLQH